MFSLIPKFVEITKNINKGAKPICAGRGNVLIGINGGNNDFIIRCYGAEEEIRKYKHLD
jgi:hypothetical protein